MAETPALDLPLNTRCRIVCNASAFTRLWIMENRKGVSLYSAPDLWAVLSEAMERGFTEAMLEVDGGLYLLTLTVVE